MSDPDSSAASVTKSQRESPATISLRMGKLYATHCVPRENCEIIKLPLSSIRVKSALLEAGYDRSIPVPKTAIVDQPDCMVTS